MSSEDRFGPGDIEYCPKAPEDERNEDGHGAHCNHWFDGEPCCWCETNVGNVGTCEDCETAVAEGRPACDAHSARPSSPTDPENDR